MNLEAPCTKYIPLQTNPRETPQFINLTERLLDIHLQQGHGERVALLCPEGTGHMYRSIFIQSPLERNYSI